MALVYIIDAFVVGGLIALGITKGVERTLPFFVFCLIVFPLEAQAKLPGLFDITVHRLAIVTFACLCLFLKESPGTSTGIRSVPLKYLMLLQIFWSFVATLNSVVFSISLKTVISQGLDFFLLYYVVLKTVSRLETVHRILAAGFFAIALCCFFGYLEAYHQWSVMDLFPKMQHHFGDGEGLAVDISRGIRARSTFPHPILFGTALVIAIPWGFYLLSVAKRSRQRLILWACMMFMFMNIYKTESRGPWLALMFSLVMLFLLATADTGKRLMFVGLLTLSVLVVRPGVWETIKNTYLATLDPDTPEGESYQWRYALMRIGREAVGRSLGREMWGYGPESFFYLGLEGKFQGRIVKYESCDSSIVALIVETGYIGLLIAAALLIKAALLVLRDFKTLPKPRNQLNLILLTNMITFYFLMTNVASYGWGQQAYMLWIVIALGMVYGNLVRQEAPAPHGEGLVLSPKFLDAGLADPQGA